MKNIVRSATPCTQNRDRCWMNISFDRIKAFADCDYAFECIIDGVEYKYVAVVRELERAFIECGVDVMPNPDRYSFYLDYRTGCIYRAVSVNEQNVVIELTPLDGEQSLNSRAIVCDGAAGVEQGPAMQPEQEEVRSKWMKLMQTVGISSFLKYYLVFKHYPNKKCIQAMVGEDYTQNTKATKASAARSIFKEKLNVEVLRYIRDESSVSEVERCQASWYLILEENV